MYLSFTVFVLIKVELNNITILRAYLCLRYICIWMVFLICKVCGGRGRERWYPRTQFWNDISIIAIATHLTELRTDLICNTIHFSIQAIYILEHPVCNNNNNTIIIVQENGQGADTFYYVSQKLMCHIFHIFIRNLSPSPSPPTNHQRHATKCLRKYVLEQLRNLQITCVLEVSESKIGAIQYIPDGWFKKTWISILCSPKIFILS